MPNGQTVLDNTLSNIPASLTQRILVLQPGNEQLASRYQQQWQIVYAQQAEHGMGESLASGIRAAQRLPKLQGILVALGDMPFIQTATFMQVAYALQPDNIVIPHYQEKRGHPVGFGRDYFPALSQLKGDQGAQALLKQHPQHCHILDVNDAGILKDIDRPKDLHPA